MPEVAPEDLAYRARLEHAKRQSVAHHRPVRCGDCSWDAAWLDRVPEGVLLRAFNRDKFARLAMKDLKDASLDAKVLTPHAWLINYPEAVTGPVTVECTHHGPLEFTEAKREEAIQTYSPVFLRPIRNRTTQRH